MSRSDVIVQPASRTTLDALQSILESGEVERLDVAVAYITGSGAYDFLKRATHTLGDAWAAIPKRWITSFDYCRTEPVALECLRAVPNSTLRVYDGEFCLQHGCAPKLPFHPKTFLVRTDQRDFALAGSGNMSRSGLSRGVEAGLVLSVSRAAPVEPTAAAAITTMRTWFSNTWRSADPLTNGLLDRYGQIFDRKENLRDPTPTEDDVAATYQGRGALSTKDLQRLRVCSHFWTEAGNISKNRGRHLPGNQLMMKRLSRVYFGFDPGPVPRNTHIGDVWISFNDDLGGMFSLTYSDNGMDKLILPVPGAGGPPAYDNKHLLFRRIKPRVFELTIGTSAEKARWLRMSTEIGGKFRMSSGREWGIF